VNAVTAPLGSIHLTIIGIVLVAFTALIGFFWWQRRSTSRINSDLSLLPTSAASEHQALALRPIPGEERFDLAPAGEAGDIYGLHGDPNIPNFRKLSLLQRWALTARARSDYRQARGYRQRAMLSRAQKRLKQEIKRHEKELSKLTPQLDALNAQEGSEARRALEAHLIQTKFDEVRGVGPTLRQDIFSALQPTAFNDLYGAYRVRGVGSARQQAIEEWIARQEAQIARDPGMNFPGKRALQARYADRRKEIESQITAEQEPLAQKTRTLQSVTSAFDQLKEIRARHFARAIKGSARDIERVEAFESGVFSVWESPPEWFLHAADETLDREAPERPGRHWWTSRVQPLALGLRLDLGDGVLHDVDVKVEPDGEPDHLAPVSLETLARYDYIQTAPDGRSVLRLSEEDRQLLLALRSLGTRRGQNGRISLEMTPEVLAFLRKQENVEETARSAQLRAADKPQKPVLGIDYRPEQGLILTAGYGSTAETIVRLKNQQTSNGSVQVRTSDGFALVTIPKSDAGRTLVEAGRQVIMPELVPDFWLNDLPRLKSEFTPLLTDTAKQIRVTEIKSTPTVRADIDAPGWLRLQVEYAAGKQKWSHRELVGGKHSERFQRVGDYQWVKARQAGIDRVESALQQLEAQQVGGAYRIPLARFASLEEFVTAVDGKLESGDDYRTFLQDLTDFEADPNYRLSDALERDLTRQALLLRPYQRAGIHWFDWLHKYHLNGLLADDMGLGKTLQAICAMRQAYTLHGSKQHSLVIAPKSVMVHWQREFGRVFPDIPVYLYHGSDRYRARKLMQRNTHPAVFVTTYATAANDIDHLSAVPFYFLLLDEATNVKNPSARRSQSVKALNAQHRMALSGTPVENRPAELWSIYDFLMAGHLGRYGTFERVFETPILAGDSGAAERLGRRVGPFMLRREKRDVAKDLPEKIEMNEWCELSDEQRALYKSYQSESERIRGALSRGEQVSYAGSILPLLTKLKQICNHPALVAGNTGDIWGRSEKFDLIFQQVRTIHEQREQAVIFSHFLGMLDLFERACQEERIGYIRIDGSTNDRQSLVDQFNRDGVPVALCSLMAAGHGINLTAANHVIHADRWWNPAVEAQATDRVHRIGQDKTVYVYRFLVQGTLEEWIDALLTAKREMAQQIVGAAGDQQLHWTREELMEILRPID